MSRERRRSSASTDASRTRACSLNPARTHASPASPVVSTVTVSSPLPRALSISCRRVSSLGGSSNLIPRDPMAREQVVRRQVAETGEAVARRARVLVAVEVEHRLAQAEVARRPGVGPGEMAPRNHSAVHSPIPGRAVSASFTSSSGSAASARRSRSLRAMPIAYSAFRREKPSARISSGSASAIRSRVGKAYARLALTPKAWTKRLRTAKAAFSEICCAVIAETSVSYGSGESGGRKPRSSGTIRARTGSVSANA